ncbi:MAG: hypothetical protein ACRENH_05415 [Gemmatimonadaceae bacterium]
MRPSVLVRAIALAATASCREPTSSAPADEWLTVTSDGMSIRAVRADSGLVPFVHDAIRNGEQIATTFFTAAPLQPYTISIYPDRTSLTDHWRVAWQFPSFQAECWMIAAAWATELNLLSPRVWSRDACGHSASNTTQIRNVFAHEVVHVLHGQVGQHANLGSMVNAQWFTEGLATYISGMLDADYAGAVQARLSAGFAPRTLAEVWNDQANYPLSASIVRYIDRRFGRAALRNLLGARSSSTILTRLGIGEAELLTAWRADYGPR